MGFLDKLFGRRDEEEERQNQWEQQRRQDDLRRGANATRPMGGAPGSGYQPQRGGPGPNPQQMTDEQAVERYRYMLRTAPPETLEQAHAEAFSQLTPQQRQMVLQELTKTLPEHERRAQYSDDPQSLARMATRAEMRQPGTMERTFSGVGGSGIGLGGLMAGSFFSSFAGMMVGSMVASAFFGGFGGGDGNYGEGYQEGYQDAQNAEGSDAGGETGGDYGTDAGGYGDAAASGAGDYGGYDSGGGFGDFGGGDFGGDFGGGDFGGGDF